MSSSQVVLCPSRTGSSLSSGCTKNRKVSPQKKNALAQKKKSDVSPVEEGREKDKREDDAKLVAIVVDAGVAEADDSPSKWTEGSAEV